MILIYENFFFKRQVKPKNNKELFCYLIVQYIIKRIQKIKLNAFVNLIIYKECQPKRYNRNNIYNMNTYEDDIRGESRLNHMYRKPYISERTKRKSGDK